MTTGRAYCSPPDRSGIFQRPSGAPRDEPPSERDRRAVADAADTAFRPADAVEIVKRAVGELRGRALSRAAQRLERSAGAYKRAADAYRAALAHQPDATPGPRWSAVLAQIDQTSNERNDMKHFWIKFSHHAPGCVDAENADEAKRIAKEETGHEATSAQVLPYPAPPRIHTQSDCPAFCYTPGECAGRTSCPKRRSCDD